MRTDFHSALALVATDIYSGVRNRERVVHDRVPLPACGERVADGPGEGSPQPINIPAPWPVECNDPRGNRTRCIVEMDDPLVPAFPSPAFGTLSPLMGRGTQAAAPHAEFRTFILFRHRTAN